MNDALYITLIVIFVLFVICLITAFVFRMIISGRTQKLMFWVFLCAVLVILYFVIGGSLITGYKHLMYLIQTNEDMRTWDMVWYVMAFVGALMLVALLVKTIRDGFVRVHLMMLNIAWIFVILSYTIIYVIYKFREQIALAALITFVIVMAFIIIFLINDYFLGGIQLWSIVYIIFGMACIAFIVAFIILCMQTTGIIHDYFNK
jgi:hypothetical protein